MNNQDVIERFADLAHQMWSGWTRWMLDNLDEDHIQGWERQIATPYKELSEAEKDSDRREARRMLDLMKEFEEIE